MSPTTPVVTGPKLIRVLEKCGFEVRRQKGSHVHLRRASDGRRTTVPVHGSTAIPIGTLKGILKDVGISQEQLRELL